MLECSEAWRKGGPTAKPASSILRLLGALDELPAAAMLNASYAMEGTPQLCLQQLVHDCNKSCLMLVLLLCALFITYHTLSSCCYTLLAE